MKGLNEKNKSAASSIKVKKVGAKLGAEISGVNLRKPLDEGSFQVIQASLVEHELIIFRNQNISSENLIDFGSSFGELTVHPFSPNDENTPTLIKFENKEGNPPFLTNVWHTDETFREAPPKATILCAKEVPEIGGDTIYASMTGAYEGLSDRMQHFISGLEAIHDFKPFKTLFSNSAEDRKNLQYFERLYPPVTHPVVRIHPLSNKKILYVNPQFTIRIKDMDERESKSLLDTLFYQALIPENQFRHHWEPHTIVIWDNYSTNHYAVHDYYPQRRIMERVTIKGEKPFGVETADPNTVCRAKYAVEGVDPHGGHRPQRQFQRDLSSLK